jgi:LysR family glycine cleavage system transcriptional activator
MAQALPPLAWIRTFEAAARRLSFAGAAKELDITPAAASQHMRALETRLGFALFERLPRGVALTPMGAAWLPSVQKALDELSVATAGLFGTEARGRVTLRASFSFAALCLAPRLPAFIAANPGVSLRLLTAVWSYASVASGLDLDVRYGLGDWDGAEVVRLTAPVSAPVCPPATAFGDDPAAGLRAALAGGAIHIMGCENLWTQMARDLGWPEAAVAGGVAVDSSVVALEMVAAGRGCAMIERDLAQGHLDAGRVTAPPGLALAHDQSHHLLTPRRDRPPTQAALLLRAWLTATFDGRTAQGQSR